jgi:predicted dehydrogenase
MRNVRWGIIGCGDVTEKKSGPALQQAEGSELVAVMRRTAALAEDYARRHGVPRWHADADEILYAGDIDAVYIATHPNTHREYTLRAAAAGKAVYVEKPMALDEAECREMITACASGGVPLWVAYYRRALPRFTHVRDLIADGAVGDVRAVSVLRSEQASAARWQARVGLSGGGFFFDAACHTLDFLDFCLGPIVEVYGVAARHNAAHAHETTVAASFRFESGVLGGGTWCYDAEEDADRTTVIGTAGSLSFCTARPEPTHVVRGNTSSRIELPDPPHVHQPLVQTIVDEMAGQGRCPSTGASAARTARVIDIILRDVSDEVVLKG